MFRISKGVGKLNGQMNKIALDYFWHIRQEQNEDFSKNHN